MPVVLFLVFRFLVVFGMVLQQDGFILHGRQAFARLDVRLVLLGAELDEFFCGGDDTSSLR